MILDFRLPILDCGKHLHKRLPNPFLNSACDNRKSKIRGRKLVGIVALVLALAMGAVVVQAQQPKKVYRIGFLTPSASLDASPADQAFRQSLRALGYREGQDIVIEWRRGDASQFPGFAAEMVRLNVDCIVTRGIPAIRSAKQATHAIPIVMSVSDDPVQ